MTRGETVNARVDTSRRTELTTLYRAGAAVLATLLLTSAHHLYGARRFDTPWRAHVAHIAIWAGAIFGLCWLVALRWPYERSGRIAMVIFVGLTMVVRVLWLGLYANC
jgi:cell division protein FtsW (lipid II flippase)